MYKDRPTCVEFYPLQRLNYNGVKTTEAKLHWRYLWKMNPDHREFLEKRKDHYINELNEANWSECLHPLLESLPGDIRRARLIRLPAGGSMPLHRDETSTNDIRVICPIFTSPKVDNIFVVDGEEISVHMPADGHFYCFDERLEHGVNNNSKYDRFALVFTVLNTTFEEWDEKGRG